MMEKGEIARVEQFLLFPQCFQNLSVLMRQNEYLWSKGLNFFTDKILDVTKLETVADNILNIAEMMISLFDRNEKRKCCGKRRKCWLPAFFPLPLVFSNAFFFRGIKSGHCVVKS